jgi:hypothetical protein
MTGDGARRSTNEYQAAEWLQSALGIWAGSVTKDGNNYILNVTKSEWLEDLSTEYITLNRWSLAVLYSLTGSVGPSGCMRLRTVCKADGILERSGLDYTQVEPPDHDSNQWDYWFDKRNSMRMRRMMKGVLPGFSNKLHEYPDNHCPGCGETFQTWDAYMSHTAHMDCERIRPMGLQASMIKGIWFSGVSVDSTGRLTKTIPNRGLREGLSDALGNWASTTGNRLIVSRNPLNEELEDSSRYRMARNIEDWDVMGTIYILGRLDDRWVRMPRSTRDLFWVDSLMKPTSLDPVNGDPGEATPKFDVQMTAYHMRQMPDWVPS